ncbi:MAG TPA: porin, partial [Planctomycetaceae bacterium]|nr:porin [Planctomycetaceae bacterium]
DWKTGWNHGIEWVSPDKAFKVHIGGRTQFDSVFIHQDGNALAGAGGGVGTPTRFDQDAVDFRRARLRADGTIFDSIEYLAEFDLVNSLSRDAGGAANTEFNTTNIPAPTDLWWNFKDIPWIGNIRVGNHKEWIGFEHMISSRFLNFMERSYNQDLFSGPFNNGFTPGISAWNTYAEERGMWAIGLFKNTQNVFAFNVGDGEYATTGRVTYLLIDDKECHQLLHIGAAGSVRDPDNGTMRFRTRSLRNGPANLATIYADTGNFHADTQWLSGLELAGIFGAFSFQAEWIGSWCTDTATLAAGALPPGLGGGGTKGTAGGTIFTQGYYAELHYFLTGESRDYNRKEGAFTRIVPNRNFRWKNGCFEPGAWQILFRYANADLNDKGLQGGLVQDYTVGVNWFLNPNMKIQWNYVCTERDFKFAGVDGGLIHGFGMRLAHDF